MIFSRVLVVVLTAACGLTGVASANADEKHRTGGTPTVESLLGGKYRSIKSTGNRLIGNRDLGLHFFMHANNPTLPERPTLVFTAGCNSNGSKFRIKNGRLRTYGGFMGTLVGCEQNADPWLTRKLNKSMKVSTRNGLLILSRPNEGVRFELRRVGPTRFG